MEKSDWHDLKGCNFPPCLNSFYEVVPQRTCDINPACSQFIAFCHKLAAFSLVITLATNLEANDASWNATSRGFTQLIIEARLADKETVFKALLPVWASRSPSGWVGRGVVRAAIQRSHLTRSESDVATWRWQTTETRATNFSWSCFFFPKHWRARSKNIHQRHSCEWVCGSG